MLEVKTDFLKGSMFAVPRLKSKELVNKTSSQASKLRQFEIPCHLLTIDMGEVYSYKRS